MHPPPEWRSPPGRSPGRRPASTARHSAVTGAGTVWGLGRATTPLCEVGWKSLGVLALTALPSIDEEHWVPMVQQTDALLVGGGDPVYPLAPREAPGRSGMLVAKSRMPQCRYLKLRQMLDILCSGLDDVNRGAGNGD
jgi:hypothetical protein